jgi:hypothetical protein
MIKKKWFFLNLVDFSMPSGFGVKPKNPSPILASSEINF